MRDLREREAIVNTLADAGAIGINEAMAQGLEATPSDVISACLTLTARCCAVVMRDSEPEDLRQNRDAIRQAIMQLLMATTEGETPQ